MKKDFTYICNYLKALVISHMPDDFKVAEKFRHGLTDDEIQKGITTFREFLYSFYDKLIIDYKDEPYDEKTPEHKRIPLIYDLSNVLFFIGFCGKLEVTPNMMMLTVHNDDLNTNIGFAFDKSYSLAKMSDERKVDIFNLLSDLGLRFNGTEFSEEILLNKNGAFHVTYNKNIFLPLGLNCLPKLRQMLKRLIFTSRLILCNVILIRLPVRSLKFILKILRI